MIKDLFINNKKYILTFSIILFLDLFSKYLFWTILPFEKIFYIFKNNYFYLTLNKSAVNSISAELLYTSEIEFNIFIISIISLIIGIYIIFVKNKKIKLYLKIISGFSIYFFLYILLNLLPKNINLNTHLISLFSKLSATFLIFTFFYISKNVFIRILWITSFASGCGNSLSHIIPPYYVIDFLYIDRLNKIFRFGIFNFADFAYLICMILIMLYFIYFLLRKIMKIKYLQINNSDNQ